MVTHEYQCETSPLDFKPGHVNSGVWVLRSQILTVVSPEPLAKRCPSGLKATESTASVWPAVTNTDLRKPMK